MTADPNQDPLVCRGFTLVEIAIALVILGVLLVGLLKGAEMIDNAKIKATIADIKAIDAAAIGFKDAYKTLPGDILNPQMRLPNCIAAAANCTGGAATLFRNQVRGNGFIDSIPVSLRMTYPPYTSTDPSFRTENALFFPHIVMAGFLAGGGRINISPDAAPVFGDGLMASPLGGGWGIGYYPGIHPFPPADPILEPGRLPGMPDAVGGVQLWSPAPVGHYLSSRGEVSSNIGTRGIAPGEFVGKIRLRDIQTLDLKMDDGKPNKGRVQLVGPASVRVINGNDVDYAVGQLLRRTRGRETLCAFYVQMNF